MRPVTRSLLACAVPTHAASHAHACPTMMTRRIKDAAFAATLLAGSPHASNASQSFGTAMKGWHLPCQKEVAVFFRDCSAHEMPCSMQHYWSGGTFDNYTGTRVRYYVDASATGVDIPLGLGHGSAPDRLGGYEDNGPWAAGALFGKSGVGLHAGGASHGSGLWNNIQIPFGFQINVTVALGCKNRSAEYFWLVLRGRTKASVVLPGAPSPLPPQARLRSFESSFTNLPPYAYLPFFNSSAQNGAVLFVTLAVRSPMRSFQFLEGMVRATSKTPPSPPPPPRCVPTGELQCEHMAAEGYLAASRNETARDAARNLTHKQARAASRASRAAENRKTWLLSSGTEDYFLGTFYFNKGQFFNPLAGLTSLCPLPKGRNSVPHPVSIGCVPDSHGAVRFSAYRVHGGYDPLEFENGHASSWRNGEPGHGGAGATVNASAFALVYEW